MDDADCRVVSRQRTMRVGALVVSWNRRDDALECVESLLGSTYPSLVVYVVDNGSDDGFSDAVTSAYPVVRLIRSERNLGFAAGSNLGLTAMRDDSTDLAFLVNDDAVVAHDAVDWLVAGMREDPAVGALAPKVLIYHQPDVIWSAGGMLDRGTGVSKQRYYGEKDVGQAEAPVEVDYAVGCAMLVRMNAIRAAGLLDPRYFLYYEEADWCRRIRQAGYKVMYMPLSRVWHKVELPDVSRNDAPYYCSRNRLLFLNADGAAPGKIAWIAISDLFRSAAIHAAKGRMRESRLILKAVVDYYTNNFGRLGERRRTRRRCLVEQSTLPPER